MHTDPTGTESIPARSPRRALSRDEQGRGGRRGGVTRRIHALARRHPELAEVERQWEEALAKRDDGEADLIASDIGWLWEARDGRGPKERTLVLHNHQTLVDASRRKLEQLATSRYLGELRLQEREPVTAEARVAGTLDLERREEQADEEELRTVRQIEAELVGDLAAGARAPDLRFGFDRLYYRAKAPAFLEAARSSLGERAAAELRADLARAKVLAKKERLRLDDKRELEGLVRHLAPVIATVEAARLRAAQERDTNAASVAAAERSRKRFRPLVDAILDKPIPGADATQALVVGKELMALKRVRVERPRPKPRRPAVIYGRARIVTTPRGPEWERIRRPRAD